jgi:hypothetical protein
MALQTEGKLTEELCKFLISDAEVAHKLALINALGWSTEGKNNAAFFLRNSTFRSEKELFGNGKTETIICYAYLLAMDNYLEVSHALKVANIALRKNPNNFSIHLIQGLIKAQHYMNESFCEVYRSVEMVKMNTTLKQDLNADAQRIIFDSIDPSKEYCK